MKKPIIAGIAFLCSLMFIFACNNIKKNQDKNKEDSRKAEKKGNSEISIQDTIEQNETYNSIARILAGKDINDSLNFKEIIKTAEYKNHQKKIKNIWRNFNTQYEVIKGKPYIVATRNIKAGSEIFVSYGKDYWKAMMSED